MDATVFLFRAQAHDEVVLSEEDNVAIGVDFSKRYVGRQRCICVGMVIRKICCAVWQEGNALLYALL